LAVFLFIILVIASVQKNTDGPLVLLFLIGK